MKLAIFGATGRIGSLLVRQALDGGHDVAAYARREDWAKSIASERLRVITGPLDSRSIAETIAGSDAVISALAAGNGTLKLFDQFALPLLEGSGPRRLVSLVGASVRMPGDPDTFSLRLMSTIMRLVPTGVFADATAHADALARSTLDWTLVRAANFADRPPTGRLRAETAFQMSLSPGPTSRPLCSPSPRAATSSDRHRWSPIATRPWPSPPAPYSSRPCPGSAAIHPPAGDTPRRIRRRS